MRRQFWHALLAVLMLCGAVHADTTTVHIESRGDTIALSVQPLENQMYIRQDDPALQQLLIAAGATLSWAGDNSGFFLYGPAGEVSWDVSSNRGTIHGEAADLPHATRKDGSHVRIALSALVKMMGLTLHPMDSQGTRYVLLSTLFQAKFTEENGRPTVVLLGTGRLDPVFEEPLPGRVTLTLPKTACSLPQDDMKVGLARLQVRHRGDASRPTVLELTFPQNWKGALGSRLLNNQVLVHARPAYPPHGYMRNTQALRHSLNYSEETATFTLEAVGPFAYAWDLQGDTLELNLLHITPTAPMPALDAAGPLREVTHTAWSTDPYPIMHYRFKLSSGQGFKLEKQEGADTRSLTLTLGPLATYPVSEASGIASFLGGGGHGVIVIDPGHGGGDPGCVSPHTGVRECDITLDISLRLKAELEARGWTVLMTREEDRDVSYYRSPDKVELGARVAVANDNDVDLFLSIHCNSSVNQSDRGTSLHWYKPEDFTFAQALEASIGDAFGVPMRGLRQNKFYVLRHTRVPAVLIETAYLSHYEEGALLSTADFRARLATAITQALGDYMGQYASTVRKGRGQ